jgi:APA family basic amino acid/polyamine antiporter
LLPLVFIAAYIFVGISIAVNTPDLALIGTGVFAAFLIIYFLVTRFQNNDGKLVK